MHIDQREVDIKRHARQLLAAPFSHDAFAGKYQDRLAQHRSVRRLDH